MSVKETIEIIMKAEPGTPMPLLDDFQKLAQEHITQSRLLDMAEGNIEKALTDCLQDGVAEILNDTVAAIQEGKKDGR